MASCSTSQWGNNYSPQAVLNVNVSGDFGNSVNLYWTLDIVFHGFALSSSVQKSWSINIDGQVRSGSVSIGGVTGTKRVADGTITVGKNQSPRNVGFNVSFAFNASWNGSYSGTRTAYGSLDIGAIWSSTVSYNANGGQGAPSPQTKWYGSLLTLSNVSPTRTGYIFKGWGTSSGDTTPDYQPGGQYGTDSNITLYAIWEAITYQVTYDANGGQGAPSAQTKTYGVTLKLSATKPTRTNYNFLGWGTSASSTTVAYSPGGDYTNNVAITLYAVWEVAYKPPIISNVAVERCNSSGNLTDEGTYIHIAFKWELDSVYSSGLKSITVGYKLSTATTYTDTKVSGTGMSGTVNTVIGSGKVDTEYQYDVKITVVDDKGSSYVSRVIAPLAYIIDFLSGGNGVAFGKPASEPGFDNDMESKFRKGVSFVDEGKIATNLPVSGDVQMGGSISFKDSLGAYKPFMKGNSNGAPVVTSDLTLSQGVWQKLAGPNSSTLDFYRMNSSGQVELNWTNGGLKGRAFKKLWEGNCGRNGTMTSSDFPYYNMFCVTISGQFQHFLFGVRDKLNPVNGFSLRGGVWVPVQIASYYDAYCEIGFVDSTTFKNLGAAMRQRTWDFKSPYVEEVNVTAIYGIM